MLRTSSASPGFSSSGSWAGLIYNSAIAPPQHLADPLLLPLRSCLGAARSGMLGQSPQSPAGSWGSWSSTRSRQTPLYASTQFLHALGAAPHLLGAALRPRALGAAPQLLGAAPRPHASRSEDRLELCNYRSLRRIQHQRLGFPLRMELFWVPSSMAACR